MTTGLRQAGRAAPSRLRQSHLDLLGVDGPERNKAARVDTRSPWIYAVAGAAVAGLVAAGVIAFVLVRDNSAGQMNRAHANYNALPGTRRTKALWPPEYQFLADRLLPLGLTTEPGHQGLGMHFHAHLDIFVNGKHVVVPALIGINAGAGWLTELHTHDARGVMHIEAQKPRDFVLGQFVAVWGVFLNSRWMGAYCDGLTWYVDGKRQSGTPEDLLLKPHQEIALVVGNPPKKIPSAYTFAPGV